MTIRAENEMTLVRVDDGEDGSAPYIGADKYWYIDGVSTGIKAEGTDGDDGTPIVWKGSLASAPSNPVVDWCYRNTTDGKVYIYNGSAWVLMTQDGEQGADGPQGFSIITSVKISSSTEDNWVTWGTTGHIEEWAGTSEIRNNCRVGDLFTVVGTSNEGNAHTLTYKSTTALGNLKGECLSSIVSEAGESGSYLVSTSIWYGKSESNTSYADIIWYSWSGGNIPVTTDPTKPYLWTKTEYIYSDTSLNKTTYNVSVTNDSIKVGGRNYALSTGEEISITGTNVDNQTVKLYDLSLSIDELNTIEPNCLLISFDMSISNGITGESGTPSISVGQYDSPWNRISVTETEIGTYHNQIIIPNRTWTTPIVGCRLNYINTNCTIIFSNFKLEIGNKYTDWTPAVEDVGNNVITQIQNLTPKIFYAYSSSSNGGDNFSITNSDLQYVGEYTSMSSEQSLNYSDYTWGINPSWASKYADNYIIPISGGGIKLISPDVSTYAGLTPLALAFYLGDIEQARIGYDSDLMNAYGVVASNIFAYGNGSGVRFDNSEQAVIAGGGRGRFTWEVRQNGHLSLKRL